MLDQINAGDASDQRNDGGMDENSIRSVFGRVNYNFAERYLLEVTLRYDGSSRFPKDNRFDYSLPYRQVGAYLKKSSSISILSRPEIESFMGTFRKSGNW